MAYIIENWRQSAARDMTTAAIFLFLWSIGHFANSSALEWIGVVLGGLFTFVRVLAVMRGAMESRMTPDEARAWLDKNFPRKETAND